VQQHDDQVAEPEREPVRTVRRRNGERDDEEGPHPAEEQQPEPQEVRGDRVRQPRVAVVHPPDDGEHHDDVCGCGDTAPAYEHVRELRDREDEDEVEEQLERGDGHAAVDELRHRRIIAQWGGGAASAPPHTSLEGRRSRSPSPSSPARRGRSASSPSLAWLRGIATRQGSHAAVLTTYYAQKYGIRPEQFPNATLADRVSLSLPLYAQMTDAEQDFVVSALRKERP
jgi:hypothetical protein